MTERSSLRTPVKGSTGTSLDTSKIHAILSKVDEADSMTEHEAKGKDLVLVVGNTGAGKSTFLNYLIGKRMIEDRVQGSMKKGFRCDDPVFEIGFGFDSKTQFPQVFYDRTSGLTFCDCPGFNDNRGVDFDISNMYAIARLVDSARSVKCIVLLDYYALLSDRSSSLLSMLGICEKLFGKRSLINVGLVISKSPIGVDRNEIVEFLMSTPTDIKSEIWGTVFRECIVYDPLGRNGCAKESILRYIRSMRNVTLGFSVSSESELFLLSVIAHFSSNVIADIGNSRNLGKVINNMAVLMKFHVFEGASSNLTRQFESVHDNIAAELSKLAMNDSNEDLLKDYIKHFELKYRILASSSLRSLRNRKEERERILRQERELREAAQRERELREMEEMERQKKEREMREAIKREQDRQKREREIREALEREREEEQRREEQEVVEALLVLQFLLSDLRLTRR